MIINETANNKRIAKNTIMLYIRMILTMLISLYTSRVVLKTLGVEDFGIYNVVGGIIVMFGFLNSAMTNATQRYLSYELGKGDYKKLNTVFSSAVIIHVCIAFIILLLSESVGLWLLKNKLIIPDGRESAAFWMFQFSIMSFMLTVINVPNNAIIISHEKMSFYAYISIIEALLKLGIVFLLTLINFDKLILYGLLIFSVGFIVFVCYLIYRRVNFPEIKLSVAPNKSLIREMSLYAGWNLFSNLACSFSSQGVNILLNMFFGPAINAARGVAYQVQAAIIGFSSNFITAVNPQLIKSYASGNSEYSLKLMSFSSKYSFYLLYIIVLPVMAETQFILELWLENVPEYTSIFIKLILLSALIDSIVGPVQTVVQATGKIRQYQFGLGVIFLLTLPVSYLLLKLGFSAISVFVVGVFSSIIGVSWRLFMLRKIISFSIIEYIRSVCAPVFIVTIVSFTLTVLLNKFISTLSCGVAGNIIIIFSAIIFAIFSCYFFGMTRSERNLAKEKLSQVANRVFNFNKR